jgi:proline iminopeptidase
MIDAGDGHWLYVEEIGRRGGAPAVFLHGGPGSGAQHAHRLVFDPARHHAILFDQRGAGRSHPYLSLHANTTNALVGDLEAIRAHFGFERWLVVGGSWGSTLALAYAEAHPERVAGLVLRAVFLGTRQEVDWAFVKGPQVFRLDLFEDWLAPLDRRERLDPLAAYLERLADPDPARHIPAAHAWHAYERALSELQPARSRLPAPLPTSLPLPPTPFVEAHYIRNDFFLAPSQLLRNAGRLKGIPGAIIQGRYDLLCPPNAAYALAQSWPDCKLTIMEAVGHAMSEPGVVEAMRDALLGLTSHVSVRA